MVKKIPKLTTDNPQDNYQMALNFTDIGEDGWVWMRKPERTLVEVYAHSRQSTRRRY